MVGEIEVHLLDYLLRVGWNHMKDGEESTRIPPRRDLIMGTRHQICCGCRARLSPTSSAVAELMWGWQKSQVTKSSTRI